MSMPKKVNVNQHYIPVSYLTNFAPISEKDKKPRKRRLITYNLKSLSLEMKKTEDVCSDDNFYSTDGKKEADFHSPFDNEISRAIEVACTSSLAVNAKNIDFLLKAIYFRIRIKALDNKTGLDRLETLNRAVESVIPNLFAQIQGATTPEETHKKIHRLWGTVVISAPKDGKFITSDNPAVLTHSRDPLIESLFLPLSPNKLFLGYRKDRIKIASLKATPEDMLILNGLSVFNADEIIVSSTNLGNKLTKDGISFFNARKNKAEQFIDNENIALSVLRVNWDEEKKTKISFLRRI